MKIKIKNLKPIRYCALLLKYNNLEIDYEILKNAVSKNLFKEIISQITTPEEIQKRDRRIKQLEKQNKILKETIKILEEK